MSLARWRSHRVERSFRASLANRLLRDYLPSCKSGTDMSDIKLYRVETSRMTRPREYPKSDAPIRELKLLLQNPRSKSNLIQGSVSASRMDPRAVHVARIDTASRCRYSLRALSMHSIAIPRLRRSKEGREVTCVARQSETERKRKGGGSIISRGGMRDSDPDVRAILDVASLGTIPKPADDRDAIDEEEIRGRGRSRANSRRARVEQSTR